MKNKTSTSKKLLAFLLATVMLFACLPLHVFASDTASTSNSVNPEDKLTDELKEAMDKASNDEYIPVSIWLCELDDSYVYDAVSKTYGVEINQNNENAFLQKQVSDKTAKFHSIASKNEMTIQTSEISVQPNELVLNKLNTIRSNSIVNDTISDADLKKFIESGNDISEIITRSEQNAYMREWRNARQNINSRINKSFEDSLNLNKCRDVYVDSLIGYATLEAKNSYIFSIASLPSVDKIDLLIEEQIGFEDLLDEETVESTSDPLGYHMFQSKLPTGYTGLGVNIGVLETTSENTNDARNANELDAQGKYIVHYDPNNVHLANKTNIITRIDPNMQTDKISTTEFDRHATNVLAVLCGNPVESTDGIMYQGVAPNANVYYTNVFADEDNVRENIAWLVQQNVDIINLSTGYEDNYSYDEFDNYFDCLVQQYRIAIVVAAGNEGWGVSHPGQAYNVITVGYMTSEKTEMNQFVINSNSAYVELEYNTNKPDLVAFGTNIYMLDYNRTPTSVYRVRDDGQIVRLTGSSFTTPMVTGTVALMLEKNPLLIGKPNEIKAVLTASADNNVDDEIVENDDGDITDIGNPIECEIPYMNTNYVTSNGITRNKTGAGILNIKSSVENSTSAIMRSYTFLPSEISTDTSRTTEEYYFEKNTTFKLGLVFEKNDHKLVSSSNNYDNDINIEMIDVETNEVVMRSRPSGTGTSSEITNSKVNNVELFWITVRKTGEYRFRIYFQETDVYDSTPKPDCHKTEHRSLDATIIITCSCDEPNITENETFISNGYYYKTHDCSNCSYIAYEKFYASSCQEYIPTAGTITYKAEYQIGYVNTDRVILYQNFIVSFVLNDPTKTFTIQISGKEKQYTSLGYIETIRYEIYLFNSDNSLYNIYETDVQVEYDNVTLATYVYN